MVGGYRQVLADVINCMFPRLFYPKLKWEEAIVQEAVKNANGDKSRAARLLGLLRNALRRRLSKIGSGDESEKEPCVIGGNRRPTELLPWRGPSIRACSNLPAAQRLHERTSIT